MLGQNGRRIDGQRKIADVVTGAQPVATPMSEVMPFPVTTTTPCRDSTRQTAIHTTT
jgi:hypothetical protein